MRDHHPRAARSLRPLRPLLLVVALTPLLLAGKCPIKVGQGGGAAGGNGGNGGNGGAAGSALDIGGDDGALWAASFGDAVAVTLADNGQQASGQAVGQQPVMLLGQSIEVASFCWRTDVLCPQHLLPTQLAVAQRQGAVLLTVNRRGPLSSAPAGSVLTGSLQQRALVVPLVFGEGPCAPLEGSALHATVQPSAADAQRGDRLDGRITLVYSGACFGLGGAAAVSPDATIKLSVSFSATRPVSAGD